MPYNKGDFTQQGVAGDVSALVRLNEKRVVKVVLSSDDESDNCDISGAVTDLLNNEVYPIGAGVSGNIEITENGENINVAPYATATVNVAGGGGADLRKCTVNIVNTSANRGEGHILTLEENGCFRYSSVTINANENTTLNFMVGYSEDLEGYTPYEFWESMTNTDDQITPTYTDLVNVSVDEYYNPLIIDPTTDASFTISVGFTPLG